MRKLHVTSIAIAVTAGAMLLSAPSHATTYYLTETQANVGNGTTCGVVTHCYGTVDVTGGPTAWNFTVNAAAGYDFLIDTANATAHSLFTFSTGDTGGTISNITSVPVQGSGTFGSGTAGGYFNHPYGPFQYQITCENGSNCTSLQITSVSFLYTGLITAFNFAADILQIGGGTGAVAGGTSVPTVPLPGALLLMGTVLAGGVGFGKWRKRSGGQLALA